MYFEIINNSDYCGISIVEMSDLEEDLLALAGAGSESESDNEPLSNKRSGTPDKAQRKKKKV